MATNGITAINSAGAAVRPVQAGNLRGRETPLPATNAEISANRQIVTRPAVAAAGEPQTGEQFINEALRALLRPEGEPAAPLLVTPPSFLRVAEKTQGLNFLEENGLFITEVLRTLGAVAEEENILLVNQISPELEAAEIISEAGVVGESALQVTEILAEAAAGALEEAAPVGAEVPPPAERVVTAAPGAEPRITAAVPEAAAPAPPAAEIAGLQPVPPLISEVTAGGGAALPAATPAEVVPAVPAAAGPQAVPFRLPLSITRPDLTPYVVAVYELKNPAPFPAVSGPAPDLQPLMAVNLVQAIGRPGLRQGWTRETGRGRRIVAGVGISRLAEAERAIRQALGSVNDDLTAHGRPVHLVFARLGDELALDIYDCSDDRACWVKYEVPLPLGDLTRILGNMQDETGIILDSRS